MPEFIVRAHSAPTEPEAFLAGLGTDLHVEYLAQILVAGLFVSQGHRRDDCLTLVLENSRDYSRALTFDGNQLGTVGGMTEQQVLNLIAAALRDARQLTKEAVVTASNGVIVRATSFERLLESRLAERPVFLLDRKGEDIRGTDCPEQACFVLTDHVPLPKNLRKSLLRRGAVPVSLGPVMLHASQCIVLVQNEYDRLYSGR